MIIHNINLQCHVPEEHTVVLQENQQVCDKSFLVEYVQVGTMQMKVNYKLSKV